jgi:hypothetical protein
MGMPNLTGGFRFTFQNAPKNHSDTGGEVSRQGDTMSSQPFSPCNIEYNSDSLFFQYSS